MRKEKCSNRPSLQKFPLLIERQSCEGEKVLFELFFQTLKPSARAELLLGAKSLNDSIKIISKKPFHLGQTEMGQFGINRDGINMARCHKNLFRRI